MRRDLEAMVRLGAKWMDEVSMTTNGTLMTERRSKALSDAGLNRINVSLDSFENYQKITGGEVSVVVENLKSASRFYDPIKINMVLLKGMNEDELFDMIHFCRENSYILQLIELIPFTPDLHDLYLDLAPVEEWLSLHAEKIDIRAMHNRKKYFLDGAEIEVVKPMHNSRFCPNCKRIRVTSDGKVKPCLMRNDNLVDGLGAFKREGIGGLERSLREGINRRTPFWSLDDRHIGERAELEKSES
jgi:cyclic pyranopterin phosphate synthase